MLFGEDVGWAIPYRGGSCVSLSFSIVQPRVIRYDLNLWQKVNLWSRNNKQTKTWCRSLFPIRPWSFFSVTCCVVGPNGEVWLFSEWKAGYLVPPIDGSEYPANTPSDLQKQLCDRNDVIQNSRNPITPSMQDVEHPSSWRRLIVLFPAASSNLASSDITWNLRKKTNP